MEDKLARRRLGQSTLQVSPIGLGCWQFSQGTGLSGKFWATLSPAQTREIVAVSLTHGVNWFDTAEVYGRGRSEAALADALHAAGPAAQGAIVATKWWPLLRTASSITASIDTRLAQLGGWAIDLYQVHQPFSLSSIEAQMAAMATLVEEGKIRHVGVSNFSARRMRRAHAALAKRGLVLASNQVKYSLLDRRIERNGILVTAQELGVSIMAYSPLEQGLLTGKFHDQPSLVRERAGFRKYLPAFRPERIAASQPLITALREVGERHGVSAAQVALNWVITSPGERVVAIAGATSAQQAADNAAAMDFTLSEEERSRLEELSRKFARF